MYEAFFGLQRRPFPAVAQAAGFFAAKAIETARATLARCIERGEGIGLLVGPSGTGKTTLCHVLAAQFDKKLRVVLLAAGRFGSRRALFQAMLYELGQPYRGLDEGETRLALSDYLTINEDCAPGVLLIVDEAHTMPLRLVDEIRTLTNISRQGHLQVRVLLAGNTTIEERLASPKLESLGQRITARCYLEAFSKCETREYVHTRINLAGGHGPRVFSDETCQTIHRATDGVARLIDQVCDHAMLLAFSRDERTIAPALIEESWADLQQLPTPWNGDAPSPPTSGVIEFGQLDDMPCAESPTPPPASQVPILDQLDSFLEDDEDAAVRGQQHVDEIETMLSEVDDQYRPPTKGPEIELIFDDPHHPFAQRFEQEEVIDDRRGRVQPVAAQAAPVEGRETAVYRSPETAHLLIVEDGYDHAAMAPACRVTPVRRHEYRQLFSRLRKTV